MVREKSFLTIIKNKISKSRKKADPISVGNFAIRFVAIVASFAIGISAYLNFNKIDNLEDVVSVAVEKTKLTQEKIDLEYRKYINSVSNNAKIVSDNKAEIEKIKNSIDSILAVMVFKRDNFINEFDSISNTVSLSYDRTNKVIKEIKNFEVTLKNFENTIDLLTKSVCDIAIERGEDLKPDQKIIIYLLAESLDNLKSIDDRNIKLSYNIGKMWFQLRKYEQAVTYLRKVKNPNTDLGERSQIDYEDMKKELVLSGFWKK